MPETLQLVYWDNPVLSTVCTPVADSAFGADKLRDFAARLLATMDAKNGVGLAAPQVAVTERMFAMHFPNSEQDREPWKPIVVINPTLELNGGTVAAREGCLSLPGVFEQVARAENVVMRYRDADGDELVRELTEIDARVAQHEFDHLNGIMFFDYLNIRPTYGRRMSKQVSKQVMRMWEKERSRRGL